LESWGMPGGPARRIVELVNKIKGEDQEREKKRKAEEELVITAPKKRKWMVNSAITREERPIVYFVDPTEQNVPLLELIHRGEFIALHGPRASGKSTRVLQLQDQLNKKGFVCIYLSLEQVNIDSVGEFWQTLGVHLYCEAPEYAGLNNINSASDFDVMFLKSNWKNDVILLIDEFDKLYGANEDVKSSCLETLRGIKATKGNYAIRSVVAIGPFSILYLKSNNLTTSPFNVNESFQNPNFTLEQVQFLYEQFAEEYNLIIDQEIVEDIYIQTNGHAGLVCLCGRAIFRKLYSKLKKVNGKLHVSFDIWQRFSMMSLGDELIEHQTFIRMKDALLVDDLDTKRAGFGSVPYNRRNSSSWNVRNFIAFGALADPSASNSPRVSDFTSNGSPLHIWNLAGQPQKGIQVAHIWHDLDFTKIRMIACWWNNNTKHVADVEEIMKLRTISE
ncbi:12284_t:CDS:2, partial [Ambispora gerdemannii]